MNQRLTFSGSVRASIAMGIVVAAVLLTLVEGALRLTGVGDPEALPDPFLGFTGQAPLFERIEGDPSGPVLRTAAAKQRWFNTQTFPLNKATGEKRVFCLGGSTTYGRPFRAATSFCGWLEAFLEAADPGTTWRVINAGGISYSSFRAAVLMDELRGYEPDLFIVYSGHNEFLEERTYTALAELPPWALGAIGKVARLHLFGALRKAWTFVSPPSPGRGASEVSPLLDMPEGWERYRRALLDRDAASRHFRLNLTRMARAAEQSDVPMLWVLPASNIRDMLDCTPCMRHEF